VCMRSMLPSDAIFERNTELSLACCVQKGQEEREGEGREEEQRRKERVLSVAQWKERAWRSEGV
jgi:hypothetical protein